MTAPLQFSAGSVPRRTAAIGDWTLLEYDQVGSTNLVAAGLPVWHAVRADEQTQGRGRFQRSWVSNRGGLWISGVVPMGPTSEWRALPLVVGLAVCDALTELGVRGLRLRWPNDVLVSNRKLAGLLIDQFVPGQAVAGIGINVHNHPEQCDGQLRGQVARLADLVDSVTVEVAAGAVLAHLRSNVENLAAASGLDGLLGRINQLWQGRRRVELDLDGRTEQGLFAGVNNAGSLGLIGTDGTVTFYDASQVRHLTELEY